MSSKGNQDPRYGNQSLYDISLSVAVLALLLSSLANSSASLVSKHPSIVPTSIGRQSKDAAYNLTKKDLDLLGLQSDYQMQRFLSHQTATDRIVSGDENVNEDLDWVMVDLPPTLEALVLEELGKLMNEKTCQAMLAETKQDT